MPSSTRPPAISGVYSTGDAVIMTIYPSIACTALGHWLGRLYECLPLPIFGIKLSHLLLTLPTAPAALVVYFYLKLFGERYVLTNRSVQRWKSLASHLLSQASLADIDEVAIVRFPGQKFYKAGDLVLLNAAGDSILRLKSVPYPESFRATILEARDARLQTAESLAIIEARQTA